MSSRSHHFPGQKIDGMERARNQNPVISFGSVPQLMFRPDGLNHVVRYIIDNLNLNADADSLPWTTSVSFVLEMRLLHSWKSPR